MAKEIVLENSSNLNENKYHDTPISASEVNDPDIPQKIWEMMKLYEYGDGSFEQQKKNFRRQGEFMKDYEDDFHGWSGVCMHYSPSYHDLSVGQLRKYFTWRTAARKGKFSPIEPPFAYLYLYELLCGIGTGSAEEGFRKMEDFDKSFPDFSDYGFGKKLLQKDLKQWMFDYAVIHSLPPTHSRSLRTHTLRYCGNPHQKRMTRYLWHSVFLPKKISSSLRLSLKTEVKESTFSPNSGNAFRPSTMNAVLIFLPNVSGRFTQ